jgi:DNA-directed RNA polymerase specialized sigma24 family protein
LKRDEVIKQVSEDKRYRQFCKEIGGELADDLFQEFVLRLLNMKEETIEKITNIDFYSVRTLMNMMKNKYDPFFKSFKQPINELSETEQPEESEVDKERLFEIIDEELKAIEKEYQGKYPYSVQLFRAYQNNNFNFRKTQRETGIHFVSCFKTIKEVKTRIKKRLDD